MPDDFHTPRPRASRRSESVVAVQDPKLSAYEWAATTLTPWQHRVLAALDDEPCSIAELAKRTRRPNFASLSESTTHNVCVWLAWKGLAERNDTGWKRKENG